ncbi:hypothetical protein [Paraburkholderia sp. C35]|uniref:hypothetical protein n=1 Tax=Paraburkholderia sp. C35 TaxID=2126993 RepID=UPI0013A52C6B|nr:hypothetical protein [Paraburkholderia sp. C35]
MEQFVSLNALVTGMGAGEAALARSRGQGYVLGILLANCQRGCGGKRMFQAVGLGLVFLLFAFCFWLFAFAFAGIRVMLSCRMRRPCAGQHLLFFAAAKKSRQKKAG